LAQQKQQRPNDNRTNLTPFENNLGTKLFSANNQFYQPNKDFTMGSSISSTLAEIYLQYLEEKYMKHCLEHKDIYYRRYADDLLIIYDQSRTNADKILNFHQPH
jgi:CRISPR/Cas system CMR-associated protein Cmr5 small subunit